MRAFLFILFISCLSIAQAGGPWAEGKGKGYVEAGALFPIRTNAKNNLYQLYAEIGILEKLTAKVILPTVNIGTPKNLDPRFEEGKLFGMSNMVIGLKYQVMKKKVVMAVGFDAEIKAFRKDDELGLRTGFQKYTFRPIYSVGFGLDKFYTYGEIRPGFSTNDFGHDINVIAEVGGEVDDDIWLSGYFDLRTVFNNGNFNDFDPEVYSTLGFYPDQQNFFTMGVKFAAKIYKVFGLNAGVFYGTSVSESNGGGIVSVKAGMYFDW